MFIETLVQQFYLFPAFDFSILDWPAQSMTIWLPCAMKRTLMCESLLMPIKTTFADISMF